MSFLRKRLASSVFSVYAQSKVRLFADKITCGDIIRGEIEILGGKVKQEIPLAHIFLKTEYEVETNGRKRVKEVTIQKESVILNTRIEPCSYYKFPFEFKSHENMPINSSEFGVWLEVELDSENILSSNERAFLNVQQIKEVQLVLKSIDDIGFITRSIQNKCEFKCTNILEHLPFFQEYEVVPKDDSFYREFECLGLIFFVNNSNIEVFIEDKSLENNKNMYFKEYLEANFEKIVFQRVGLNKDQIIEEFSKYLKK